MGELFYTDDFFAIYEKLDKDNVRCIARMDSEAAHIASFLRVNLPADTLEALKDALFGGITM